MTRWLVFAAAMTAAGCGEDPIDPTVNLDLYQGLYELVELGFNPQGSPPPANVLDALVEAGITPTLNVGRTGNFQLFYRDPASGDIRTFAGRARATADGLRLTFERQSDADEFLMPLELTLSFGEAEGTLSYQGPADVSRARLRALFPDLYEGEQLHDPTPGTLTVRFRRD